MTGTMRRILVALAGAALALAATATQAQAGETVRVAFIDPLSGLLGPVGNNQIRSFQFIVDLANKENWAPGVKFEIVPFDNKLSPQESLTVFKSATDQGIRYIVQGNGSGVALALSDAVTKYNERNPGKEVVFINYAAVDPDLTDSKCSFWHFRMDANSDMKMEALTSYMAENKAIKNVYLINQDYSFGHQVRRAAREYLARKRPDIQIVGDDLHPLAKVQDFAPYVAKIRAASADTVVTGNWGSDLALLIKAARDSGLDVNFYTYYAGTTGVPTAMGAAGAERVRLVSYWTPNTEKFAGESLVRDFKARFNDDYYTLATYHAFKLLAQGCIRDGGRAFPVDQWRGRNARQRSPDAAGTLYLELAEGGRQTRQIRPGKHGLRLAHRAHVAGLHRGAADQLQYAAAAEGAVNEQRPN